MATKNWWEKLGEEFFGNPAEVDRIQGEIDKRVAENIGSQRDFLTTLEAMQRNANAGNLGDELARVGVTDASGRLTTGDAYATRTRIAEPEEARFKGMVDYYNRRAGLAGASARQALKGAGVEDARRVAEAAKRSAMTDAQGDLIKAEYETRAAKRGLGEKARGEQAGITERISKDRRDQINSAIRAMMDQQLIRNNLTSSEIGALQEQMARIPEGMIGDLMMDLGSIAAAAIFQNPGLAAPATDNEGIGALLQKIFSGQKPASSIPDVGKVGSMSSTSNIG